MAEKLCKLSKCNDFKIMVSSVRMGGLGASLSFSRGFMKTFPDTAENASLDLVPVISNAL